MCKCNISLFLCFVFCLCMFCVSPSEVNAMTIGGLVTVVETVTDSDDTETEMVVHEDMQNFVDLMSLMIEFMKCEFTVMGFTFSYWQIIILVCLANIVGWFIGNVFS